MSLLAPSPAFYFRKCRNADIDRHLGLRLNREDGIPRRSTLNQSNAIWQCGAGVEQRESWQQKCLIASEREMRRQADEGNGLRSGHCLQLITILNTTCKRRKSMNKHYMIGVTTFCVSAGRNTRGVTPSLKAAGEESPVSKLLAEAKTQAYAISVDASQLESYTREPTLSWETHADEISLMKDDINRTAKTIEKLNASRSGAAPWQVAAIDRIIPFMQEIAGNTTSAIEYINKYQSRLTMKEYTDYLESNSDLSSHLAGLIAHYVDYGNAKNRYGDLKRTIELSAK